MELQQLRHFVTLAETGSFAIAADRAGISQPGLSRSIAALERALDTRLLLRDGRGVRPTATGAVLLPRARAILNDHDRTIDELAAFRSLQRGKVTFGLSSVFNHFIGPQIVADMSASGLGIELDIRTGSYAMLADSVRQGTLDFALTFFVPPDAGGTHVPDDELTHEPVRHLQSAVFARKGHPVAALPTVSADDLAQCDWILSGNEALRHRFELYFQRHGLCPPALSLAPGSLSIVMNAVATGAMLTLLPDPLAPLADCIGLTPLDNIAESPLPGGSTCGLIHRRKVPATDAAQAIMAIARAAALAIER